MATTGQQSISALARPVVRLMTPGPLAAMHTAGFCSSRRVGLAHQGRGLLVAHVDAGGCPP